MSLKKLPTGHTVVPVEGEEGNRHKRFQLIKRMVRLNPGNWLLPDTFPYFADSFYNVKVYPDDVIVMGFPKTGTTWLQEIIWTMRNNPNLDNPEAELPVYCRSLMLEGDLLASKNQTETIREFMKSTSGEEPVAKGGQKEKEEEPPAGEDQKLHPISEFVPPEGLMLPLLEQLPRPRVLKTHLAFPLLNPRLLNTAKVVYIFRNPKDLLFSYYHNTKIIALWDFSGSFDEVVDIFVNDENFYGPFWLHVKEALSRKGHPNLHMEHYERFKKDPMGSLSSLNSFLQTGLSEAQLRKICDHITFENMKRLEISPFNIYKTDMVKKEGGFFRKGQVGDWQGKLTPQQEAKMDAWIQKNSEGLDFAFEYV